MRKLLALLFAGILIIMSCSAPAPAEKMRILAEDYPPFNYVDAKGVVVGQSTDVVRSIMVKMGEDINIEVMPWAQAYQLVQAEPGAAFYSVARTAERERLFMWVGPIGSYENWLYAKKGSGVQVNSLDEAKALKAIAAVKDEAGQQKLAGEGFINFVFTDNIADGLKKLAAGEVDLWLGTREAVEIMAEETGVSPDDLEPVVFVHKADLYLAFNKNTAYSTVDAWQKALDALKK
ncbi:MAG: transporter substrate-binding domain-containing protein [Dehalococcoidia bacterium]|nr:transporter substrate-binding domain-containing protein [Dehalococcoidia bacterium]